MKKFDVSKINEKKICSTLLAAGAMFILTGINAHASGADFTNVVNPVISLINSLLKPLIALVGAAGTLYCVLLGVKFAKAEEPQDREKAKSHLKNAIIGFVLIFVLIVVLNLAMTPLQNWVSSNSSVNMQ